ncbi:NmrA-domain-containing protein, partial [Podospora conica]
MAGKKIITVFGATGLQGGSVANTFLHDPKLKDNWTVRAVTRNTTKDAAKKLEAQGAEVVAADLDDKASLVKAMEGASAVFGVTNFWEHLDKQKETTQGKNLVDAAKETGVQHFIFSSLPNVSKRSNGTLTHVLHFDGKAEVEEYAREAGIPATFFHAGFYMSNIPGKMMRPTPPDNAWTLSMPIPASAPVPVYDTDDTGKYIKAAVLHRDEVLGKRILGATEYMTMGSLVDAFKRVFPEAGKTAKYVEASDEAHRASLVQAGMREFVVKDLMENFEMFRKYGYYFGDSLDETHSLVEDKLTTYEEFLRK